MLKLLIITKTKDKGPYHNFLKLNDQNINIRKGKVSFKLFTLNFMIWIIYIYKQFIIINLYIYILIIEGQSFTHICR